MIEKYKLVKIIIHDIFKHGFISLIMMVIIILSSTLIVTISYQTRLLTAKKDLMTEEKEFLDIEWRSLIFKENLLGHRTRIERFALTKLKMIYLDPIQEYIVIVNCLSK